MHHHIRVSLEICVIAALTACGAPRGDNPKEIVDETAEWVFAELGGGLSSSGDTDCTEGDCVQFCAAGDTCSFSCEGGACLVQCEAQSTCDLSCSGGGCNLACGAESTCAMTCEGGACTTSCGEESSCDVTCEGGGCHTDCGDDASCSVQCFGGDCTPSCEFSCGDALCDAEDCVDDVILVLPDPVEDGCLSGHLTSSGLLISASVELHVVGVYESRSDSQIGYHPEGEVSVHITRPGPIVLGVTSYEPTHWTITAEEDSKILSVIALGHHAQRLTVPLGTDVTIDTYDQGGDFSGCAYLWPYDYEGCDTPGTVAAMQQQSGLTLSSFQGCYTGTSFVVGSEALGEPI